MAQPKRVAEYSSEVTEPVVQKMSEGDTYNGVLDHCDEMYLDLLNVQNSELLADLLEAISLVKLKATAILDKIAQDAATAQATAELEEKEGV